MQFYQEAPHITFGAPSTKPPSSTIGKPGRITATVTVMAGRPTTLTSLDIIPPTPAASSKSTRQKRSEPPQINQGASSVTQRSYQAAGWDSVVLVPGSRRRGGSPPSFLSSVRPTGGGSARGQLMHWQEGSASWTAALPPAPTNGKDQSRNGSNHAEHTATWPLQ